MSESKDVAAIGDNSGVEVEFDALEAILQELRDKAHTVGEANGALRSRIKQIIEETGYHKGALSQIRAIDNMSETARADFLRTFEPMFDAMIAGKWRDEAEDLLDRELEDAE